MLLENETFQRFGYCLTEISPASHKKVVCLCPQCEQPYVTRRRYYREGRLWSLCTGRRSAAQQDAARNWMNEYHQQCKEVGISPKGLPLIDGDRKAHKVQYIEQYRKLDRERTKRWQRKANQNRRQTLIGKVSNRLRVALRRYLHGQGGFSALLYTPAELQAYIQAKLEERQYLCPMCGASLEERFDIDHRIPLSSAKTVDEVIALFALSNLDVLCPPCNQHKKGIRRIVY